MKKKPGRNDPCWCGSGRKYKKCHLGREQGEPIKHWEAAKEFRNAFGKRECLVPNELHDRCDGHIVKAHTVPKSGSLKHIARDGHVYAFMPSLEKIIKNNGVIYPELVGVNNASTFTGFCARHDNELFLKLEDQEFIGSREQCFLLGYRAVAREFFAKKASASLQELRNNMDRGRTLEDQLGIQTLAFFFNMGVSAGLKDSEHHKELYDQVLLSNQFDSVRSLRISIDGPPPVMASGGIFPEVDFKGNELQDLLDLEMTPDQINFTSFFGGNYGEVVFTWLPESDKTCNRFIESLTDLKEKELTNALIRFLFEFCENVFISPDWWESLSEAKKKELIRRMAASASPENGRKKDCLIDDGFSFDVWKIHKMKLES